MSTLRAGTGLLALSLVLAVTLPRLALVSVGDGFPTELDLFLYALVGWVQQAALVLGAVLVGAGVVLRRLAPAEPEGASPESGVDWYGA